MGDVIYNCRWRRLTWRMVCTGLSCPISYRPTHHMCVILFQSKRGTKYCSTHVRSAPRLCATSFGVGKSVSHKLGRPIGPDHLCRWIKLKGAAVLGALREFWHLHPRQDRILVANYVYRMHSTPSTGPVLCTRACPRSVLPHASYVQYNVLIIEMCLAGGRFGGSTKTLRTVCHDQCRAEYSYNNRVHKARRHPTSQVRRLFRSYPYIYKTHPIIQLYININNSPVHLNSRAPRGNICARGDTKCNYLDNIVVRLQV